MINPNVTSSRDGWCTLTRSMSPYFRRENGNDGQLWCHQLYWRASLADGCARNFCTSVKWSDDGCACSHQEAKSSWQLSVRGSDKYWSNCIYAVTFISYRYNCSWHVMKSCVKTIPETGSCMLVRDCSLLPDEVEDDCCDLELSA